MNVDTLRGWRCEGLRVISDGLTEVVVYNGESRNIALSPAAWYALIAAAKAGELDGML